MPNLPWNKWFFQDWLSDPHLSMCSPATRGIWKDLLSNMVLAGVYEFEVDPISLARICRCTPEELTASIKELIRTKTAEDHEQNGNRFIRSRRLYREHISKENKRNAGRASGRSRTEGEQPSASASASCYSDDFLAFWQAYPRKVGKAKAYDAWCKLSPTLKDCLATLEWQLTSEQWRKDGGAYIPHPTTWLNQARWEDEKEEPRKQLGLVNGAVI